MTWPTDDLTRAQTDEATDDPSQARAELDALILKVKAILAEVTAAATIWHSGNDGASSGLDADSVDGYHASSLLARANHTGTQSITGTTTGTLTVARGGSGRTTATANAPIIGGTTSTGAHQSIALGTSGYVLTSRGSSLSPTFQPAAASGLSSAGISSITSGSFATQSGWTTISTTASIAVTSGQTLVVRAATRAYVGTTLARSFPSMRILHNGSLIGGTTAASSSIDSTASDAFDITPSGVIMAVSTTVRTGVVVLQINNPTNTNMLWADAHIQWELHG